MSQASVKLPTAVQPTRTPMSIIDQSQGSPLKPIVSIPVTPTQVPIPGNQNDLLSNKLKQLHIGQDHDVKIVSTTFIHPRQY